MGLDMYLRGTRSLFKLGDKPDALVDAVNAALKQGIAAEGGEFPVGEVNHGIGGSVTICAAYWRKANAIHKWFVDNVQDGVDDCGDYYVSREKLLELRQLCVDILAGDKTVEDLPPESGFFFGPTDDDEWYRDYLAYTVEQLDVALKLPERWDFEYHSSW